MVLLPTTHRKDRIEVLWMDRNRTRSTNSIRFQKVRTLVFLFPRRRIYGRREGLTRKKSSEKNLKGASTSSYSSDWDGMWNSLVSFPTRMTTIYHQVSFVHVYLFPKWRTVLSPSTGPPSQPKMLLSTTASTLRD